LEFDLLPKRKVVPYDLKYNLPKFGKFWSKVRFAIASYKLNAVSKMEKDI
jgi:hypothetical protein